MVMRRVVAALALLVGLVPASSAVADESPYEPPYDDGGRTLEVQPGSLTVDAPWIAYVGDHNSASAVVRPTHPNLGPISVESCTWDFGDGDVRPGTSERYPGTCNIGKHWAAPGTYSVHLTLRDREGRDWDETYEVVVRERPAIRKRLLVDRLVRVETNAPEGTQWTLRRTPVVSSSENPVPCRTRRPGPEPRVRCDRPGLWVLIGSDSATGWSLRVDLDVHRPRRGARS